MHRCFFPPGPVTQRAGGQGWETSTYAFKPVVLREALQLSGCILWMDSGLELRQPVAWAPRWLQVLRSIPDLSLEPESLHLNPKTVNPKHKSLHLRLQTLNPEPETLIPNPQTRNPKLGPVM